jgi:hypothetical protein
VVLNFWLPNPTLPHHSPSKRFRLIITGEWASSSRPRAARRRPRSVMNWFVGYADRKRPPFYRPANLQIIFSSSNHVFRISRPDQNFRQILKLQRERRVFRAKPAVLPLGSTWWFVICIDVMQRWWVSWKCPYLRSGKKYFKAHHEAVDGSFCIK